MGTPVAVAVRKPSDEDLSLGAPVIGRVGIDDPIVKRTFVLLANAPRALHVFPCGIT